MGILSGKVALVTGAGGGIGQGIVKRYVAEGAMVVAHDRSPSGLKPLSDEFGDSILPIVGDVSKWEDNRDAVNQAIKAFGKLDIFVGNAGIYDHAASLSSISGDKLSDAFDEIMSINVKGYLLGVRAALDALHAAKGAVVLTGSFASFASSGGGILYTAAKHAIAGLVRQLAYELAPDIRVNGVAPGVAPTRLGGMISLGQQAENSILDGTSKILPLEKIPDSDCYGGLYALLASSQDGGHITGSMFVADSGLSIRGLGKASSRAP